MRRLSKAGARKEATLTRTLKAFAPLPAIAIGAAIAALHGVAWTAYAPNVVALGVGLALTFTVRRAAAAAWMPALAALAIAATLLAPGLDGVHRWIGVGGLLLNASAALAPWILLGLGADDRRARTRASVAALVVQVVHLAQPDAGQATALGAGMLPLLLARAREDRAARPVALASVLLAGAAWLRRDPLPAVDHVERILGLAWSSGALTTAAALAAIVALFVSLPFPLPFVRAAGLYLGAAFAVTFLGNFPVPVLGAGAGPVLGWYALAALGSGWRRSNHEATIDHEHRHDEGSEAEAQVHVAVAGARGGTSGDAGGG